MPEIVNNGKMDNQKCKKFELETEKKRRMKTAESYIQKKYDCYKDYSEKSIRDVCHIWCEVIEEAQNDVKKEYEEKLRWIPVKEQLPKENGRYLTKSDNGYINILSFKSNMWSTMWYQSDITHWLPLSFL